MNKPFDPIFETQHARHRYPKQEQSERDQAAKAFVAATVARRGCHHA